MHVAQFARALAGNTGSCMRMPPAHCTRGSRINAQISPGWSSSRRASASAASLGAAGGALAVAREVRIRRRREQRFHQQRRVDAPVQRDVADRQRADRFAVVAVLQRDEFRPPRFVAAVAEPVERHLQRDFDPGRTVVGIEHLGQRLAPGFARRDREQAFGQFHRGRMRTTGEDHLLQRARLARDGVGDARLGVAEQVGPPAADRIERSGCRRGRPARRLRRARPAAAAAVPGCSRICVHGCHSTARSRERQALASLEPASFRIDGS